MLAPATANTSSVLTINPGTFAASDGSTAPSTPSSTTLTTSSYQQITLSITPLPVTIAASDSVATASGTPASRTVTYLLSNPNSIAATGASLAFPPLNSVVPGSMTTTCASGSVTSAGGQNVAVNLSGATIPANGSCTVSYVNACIGNINASQGNCNPYSGPGFSVENFGVVAGALSSNEGITNSGASAPLQAQWSALYAKTMTPASVANGDTVTMQVAVNSYFGPATTFSTTDIVPAGYIVTAITFAAGSGSLATNGADDGSDVCGGYTAPALPFTTDGSQAIVFNGQLGGNVPTSTGPSTTSCTYTVTLTAAVTFDASGQGSVVKVLTNTLSSPSFTNSANGAALSFFGNPATAAVRVLKSNPIPSSTISTTKSFTDSQGVLHADDSGVIEAGGEGYYTFTYTNPSSTAAITSLGMTDTFTSSFVAIAKAATTASAFLAAATNTCGGTLTTTPGTAQITLSGGGIAAGGSCVITAPVHSGGPGGPTLNTLGTCDIYGFDSDPAVNGNICNSPVSRNVAAGSDPTLIGTWAPSNNTIKIGATTQLTLTYTKEAGVAPIYNASFPYTIAQSTAGLPTFVILNITSNSCGSALTMTGAGTDSVTFANFSTPDATGTYSVSPTKLIDPTAFAAQTCKIVLNVQQSNTATGTANFQGLPGFSFNDYAANGEFTFNHANGGIAPLTVVNPTGVAIVKSFNPNPAPAGTSVVMTLTLDNSTGGVVDLSGVTFTDNYPATLFNTATPNVVLAAASGKTCAGVGTGTLSAAANGSSVSWSGGTIHGGDVCVITVNVIPLAKNQTNTINATDLSDNEQVPAIATSQSVAVTSSIGVVKTISPGTIFGGQTSTMKLELLNFFGNATDPGSLSLTDSLAAMTGVTAISGADVSGCGITVTVINAGKAISMTGGSIPSNGSCEIDVTLLGSTPGTYVNTIAVGDMKATVAQLSSSNTSATSATLDVVAPLTLQKAISGGPAGGVSGTFAFMASCTNPTATYPGSVTLNGATSGTSTIPSIPAGSVCTVSESATLPTPPANYQWGAAPAPVNVTTTAAGPNTANFTNTLVQQTSSLVINKTVSGAPTGGITGMFSFTASCTNPSANYNGTVVVTGGTTGTTSIASVPNGSVCSVSENATLPTPPPGYLWGTLPSAQTVVVNTSNLSFVNTLKAQLVPIAPTPVPALSGWTILIITFTLIGIAAVRLRKQKY